MGKVDLASKVVDDGRYSPFVQVVVNNHCEVGLTPQEAAQLAARLLEMAMAAQTDAAALRLRMEWKGALLAEEEIQAVLAQVRHLRGEAARPTQYLRVPLQGGPT